MKYILLLVGVFMSNITFSEQTILNNLNQLAWKYRIILVLSNQNSLNDEALFAKYDHEIRDRDVVWFILKGNQVITNYANEISPAFINITKRDFPMGADGVLLIGKDGGIKARRQKLELNTLFEEIDSMSMRQQEVMLKSN